MRAPGWERRHASAAVLACLILVGCGAGGTEMPSNVPDFLQSLASSLPNESLPPAADQPGPVPQAITGTITLVRTEDHSDARSGLKEDGTFVVNFKLKLFQDYGQGVADYSDDGSTWTYTGRYRTWTAPLEGGGAPCGDVGTENTIDYADSGGFPSDAESQSIAATTRENLDEGWYLDLYAMADEITGHEVSKSESDSGCHTVEGDAVKSESIACQAPWIAPATFTFEDPKCDSPGLDQSGTLTGS